MARATGVGLRRIIARACGRVSMDPDLDGANAPDR